MTLVSESLMLLPFGCHWHSTCRFLDTHAIFLQSRCTPPQWSEPRDYHPNLPVIPITSRLLPRRPSP